MNKNKITIEWYSLLKDIIRNIWVIILCALIGAMGFYLVNHAAYDPVYTASATLAVNGGGSSSGSYSSFTLSNEKANVLVNIFTEPSIKEAAAEYLKIESFDGTVSATVLEQTNFIELKVTSNHPEKSYELLNAVIKSHHNVGGIPEDIEFQIVEPLRELFKDEVRKIGLELGIDEDLIFRHPFPGPGLGIRVIGEVTKEKVQIVQDADYIYREEIKKAGLERDVWQYFTALPNIKSVGVMGDERTYDYTVVVRAVTSIDGMTSDWARIPFDVLQKLQFFQIPKYPKHDYESMMTLNCHFCQCHKQRIELLCAQLEFVIDQSTNVRKNTLVLLQD